MEVFPDDTIVAEEDASALWGSRGAEILGQVMHYIKTLFPGNNAESVLSWIDRGNGEVGERFWTLDPIDGTKGFLRGDQYAVAIALIDGGDVGIGVLACPSLPLTLNGPSGKRGILFAAKRNGGSFMSDLNGSLPHPIHVANADDPLKLRLVESFESSHSDHSRQDAVAKWVGLKAPSIRIDGQGKYGAVARGDAALYLRLPSPGSSHYRERIWDHAAGAIILEEAGGKVTDIYGHSLDFYRGPIMYHNQGIVASNGYIHEKILQALNKK
jgi:3'(2'), 5'-bisphosphate nucleotidase